MRLVKYLPFRRPALAGSVCVALLLLISAAWLWRCVESYFSLTRRLPAEVLVVEGWISDDGIRAAAAEFEQHGYEYIVATGGPAYWSSAQSPSTYAEMAGRELIRLGVPKDRIIVAPARDIRRQHTYESAVAAWQALQRRGIQPQLLNVFTLSFHARRSQLVYTKVYQPRTQVGVIAWVSPDYEAAPWSRAKCLLKEAIGYSFEVLLNSGRGFNSPDESASPNSVQGP